MSSKLDRLLGIIEAYAELAAGWIPSEEDDYEEFKSALEATLSAQPGERQGDAKPVAWWTPRIVSFKGVRTNAPKDVQEQVEGTVAWHAEVIGDSPAVTDRYGVTHRPMPLYLRRAAPVGVPDESIEENGKWYVLMDGARYEVSQIEAEGWDYCVSYLQKLNAATSPAPQGVECQHSWVTDGINPTCCSKCKRPAMPTHHTERK